MSCSLTSAVVGQSVAIVTLLTVGAGRTIRVVQALETLSRSGVTRLRVLSVDVAVAAARQTLAAELIWVAIVTRGTPVTAGPLWIKGGERKLALISGKTVVF